MPLREAVQNFFHSKAWKDTKDTFQQIYNYYQHNGIKAIWEEILSAFDPSGENHAYEVSYKFEIPTCYYSMIFIVIYHFVQAQHGRN